MATSVQLTDRQRAEFNTMLANATDEADRDGVFTADEIFAEIDAKRAVEPDAVSGL